MSLILITRTLSTLFQRSARFVQFLLFQCASMFLQCGLNDRMCMLFHCSPLFLAVQTVLNVVLEKHDSIEL